MLGGLVVGGLVTNAYYKSRPVPAYAVAYPSYPTIVYRQSTYVPAPVIELSSIVALHKFNSTNWLKHIQRSVAALGELTPQMMQALAPGEAYLWASKATDPVFTRRGVRVSIRPRASKHGGSTRRASDRA